MTAGPAVAIADGSACSAAPPTQAPPWIQKITGRRAVVGAPAGRVTARSRQSSVEVVSSAPYWAQVGPAWVPSRTPCQGFGGAGAAHRAAPTGGAATGMAW